MNSPFFHFGHDYDYDSTQRVHYPNSILNRYECCSSFLVTHNESSKYWADVGLVDQY